MLRVEPDDFSPPDGTQAGSKGAPPVPQASIVRDFAHPYWELLRLLREASEIEHALLVQYLYAGLSLQPLYRDLQQKRAPVTNYLSNNATFIGIAVQEMQHLREVNQLIVALGGKPNLMRQDFPWEPEIYPFTFNLERLSRLSVAKYAYCEAPKDQVDPDNPKLSPADRAFAASLIAEIEKDGCKCRPNHIGSLYRTVLEVLDELEANPPVSKASNWPVTNDFTYYKKKLSYILDEGEDDHFMFFKAVFLGSHAVFQERAPGVNVWALPSSDPQFPSRALPTNPSAFRRREGEIPCEDARRVAWLSNLQYWIAAAFLNLHYRIDERDVVAPRSALAEVAVGHMGAILSLGECLANQYTQGVPFEPLSMGYEFGHDRTSSFAILDALIRESIETTDALAVKGLLPQGYPAKSDHESLKEVAKWLAMVRTA
ncbi:hypothetical protein AYO47_01855 [Planctomyces sp. SCGC AG-212-M04]|nr:hypothetical protein AYO47_01855 [Planctomyces sp. SCGC AG-212-M04]